MASSDEESFHFYLKRTILLMIVLKMSPPAFIGLLIKLVIQPVLDDDNGEICILKRFWL